MKRLEMLPLKQDEQGWRKSMSSLVVDTDVLV